MRRVALPLLLAIFGISLHADPTNAPPSSPAAPQMQAAPAPVAVDPDDVYDNGPYPGAKYEYDEIRNRCSLTSPDIDIGSSITAQLISGEDGKVPHASSSVLLFLTSHSDDWRFADNNDLIVLFDGQRVTVPILKRDKKVVSDGVEEFLFYTISNDLLQKMSAAKSVKLGVGSEDCTFDNDGLRHLDAYANAISKLKPAH